MVALKSWNGSRAVSHKIAFGNAELRDLPDKWDRIGISSWLNPLVHLLMGWRSLSFFTRMVTLTRADQIQYSPVWQLLLLTVLSSLWRESSLSCHDGDPPPCVAPSVHYTHPQILNFCLLVKKLLQCCQWRTHIFIAFLGMGQLFPGVDDQTDRDSSRLVRGSHFSRFCFLCVCACCVWNICCFPGLLMVPLARLDARV